MILMPGSVPAYAPGKLTVEGWVLPPPVMLSCAHSIYIYEYAVNTLASNE